MEEYGDAYNHAACTPIKGYTEKGYKMKPLKYMYMKSKSSLCTSAILWGKCADKGYYSRYHLGIVVGTRKCVDLIKEQLQKDIK